MWELQKSIRYQEMRQLEIADTPSEAEKSEHALLGCEPEASEVACLAPANKRLANERKPLESQNEILEQLARRKKSLQHRLQDVLSEAHNERNAIALELSILLTDYHDAESNR